MNRPTPPRIPLDWGGFVPADIFECIDFTATIDLPDSPDEWLGITREGRAYLVRHEPGMDRYAVWQIRDPEHGKGAAGKALQEDNP